MRKGSLKGRRRPESNDDLDGVSGYEIIHEGKSTRKNTRRGAKSGGGE